MFTEQTSGENIPKNENLGNPPIMVHTPPEIKNKITGILKNTYACLTDDY